MQGIVRLTVLRMLFNAPTIVLVETSSPLTPREPVRGLSMLTLLVVLMEICVLYCAWYTARWALRGNGMAPRHLSERERKVLTTMQSDSIHRELLNRGEASRRYQERQKVLYEQLWASIGGPTNEASPPRTLDPLIPAHVRFAANVVGEYDAERERPGVFVDCLYRPSSDLPYPQEEIRRCCEFLISIADVAPAGAGYDREAIAGERDALGVALFSLDYFVDLPADEIPRRNAQNLAFVKRKSQVMTTASAKPQPGDIVAGTGVGKEECVNQVIGIGDNDQWIILTSSQTPMQVVHNAELSRWDQVEVIASAAASWLRITPPAGFGKLSS